MMINDNTNNNIVYIIGCWLAGIKRHTFMKYIEYTIH